MEIEISPIKCGQCGAPVAPAPGLPSVRCSGCGAVLHQPGAASASFSPAPVAARAGATPRRAPGGAWLFGAAALVPLIVVVGYGSPHSR